MNVNEICFPLFGFQSRYGDWLAVCKGRFNFAKSQAYRLIESAEFLESFSTIVEKQKRVLPSNEGQTRALLNCADDNEQRAKVWDKVVESAGEKPITAKMIEKVADE